jgi:hypothetical protein
MKLLPFLICCTAAVFAGGAFKRLGHQPEPQAAPRKVIRPQPKKEHQLNAAAARPAPVSGTLPPWSIPSTLHPSLRDHRADLDALIAAPSEDEAAAKTATTALHYLFSEDSESAITYVRHPVIRQIPGAPDVVIRGLGATDPARAIALGRETDQPQLLPAAIMQLAAINPGAAERELQTGGLKFPEGSGAPLSPFLLSNDAGGRRHATPLEDISIRIRAMQAVEKLAAARTGK